jgi:Barstar (barnase inhibitor)
MHTVTLDGDRITDWHSFHAVSAETFGFPEFYGRNMNAWIDCMTDVDDTNAGMTSVRVAPGEVLTIIITNATAFALRCPEQFSALVDAAAFVNWRRVELGETAVLALAYFRSGG